MDELHTSDNYSTGYKTIASGYMDLEIKEPNSTYVLLDVTHHVLDMGFHRFLVIGSNGLWDVMEVQEVV